MYNIFTKLKKHKTKYKTKYKTNYKTKYKKEIQKINKNENLRFALFQINGKKAKPFTTICKT